MNSKTSTDHYLDGHRSGYITGEADGEARGWRNGYADAIEDIRRKLDSYGQRGFQSLPFLTIDAMLNEALNDRSVTA